MAGSSFGTLFQITTWGETHGAGLGVVVDGCPAGLELCEDDIQKYLDRRKLREKKGTEFLFCQVFLKVELQEHQFLWLFTMKIRNPEIIVI